MMMLKDMIQNFFVSYDESFKYKFVNAAKFRLKRITEKNEQVKGKEEEKKGGKRKQKK